MNKSAILFITCISATSCVNFDRASNTTNYYEYNISLEQACILKNHYQEQSEEIPLSVQAVINESGANCE
jgi:hypothetical protein|tara:strand:+ start:209 stop:418 length:210 start_codon:yes stop_codon:yes gene_type:complete